MCRRREALRGTRAAGACPIELTFAFRSANSKAEPPTHGASTPRDFEGQAQIENLTENRGNPAVSTKTTWLALARIGWFWIVAGTILGTVAGCQPESSRY